jgi:hypothetical protein
MRDYGVLAILAVVWNVVEYMYGPIGGTRFAGTLFLLSAIWMIRAPSIAISLGRHEVGSVSGWKKAFVWCQPLPSDWPCWSMRRKSRAYRPATLISAAELPA